MDPSYAFGSLRWRARAADRVSMVVIVRATHPRAHLVAQGLAQGWNRLHTSRQNCIGFGGLAVVSSHIEEG